MLNVCQCETSTAKMKRYGPLQWIFAPAKGNGNGNIGNFFFYILFQSFKLLSKLFCRQQCNILATISSNVAPNMIGRR